MKIKHYLGINLKIAANHIGCHLISALIGLFAFSLFMEHLWGKVLAGVFYSGFYIVRMYSAAYKIGEKDTKVYSENKPYVLKGLVCSVLLLLISLIVVFLYRMGFLTESRGTYLLCVNLFELWNFNFTPFMNAAYGVAPVWYAVVLLFPVLCVFFGYLAGMKRYELGHKFFTKLVYKGKK